MGERRIGEGGFADAFVAPGAGTNARLDRITELFDWTRFDALLTSVRSPLGRPGYPALAMFKALLLQQWYALSDPGLEEALSDRLSFRRFCGFSLSDKTPDETVFVRFRAALMEHGLSEALFAEAARQLEARGLVVKRGTLIDASLIEASVKRPPRAGQPAAGEAPSGATAKAAGDPDAGFTRRGGRSHYGYKIHAAVDQGSGLIRDLRLTGAQVNDGEEMDALIQGDERAVYADKAYENKHRRRRLKAAGVKDRILHRSHKNQAGLPHWQRVRNSRIAPIRAAVEQLFGLMKRSYHYTRTRYRGLARNRSHLYLMGIAINMRRAEKLAV